MIRLLCVMIGYALGLIQTGYIYGKTQNVDIRKLGSGNAGATNATRTLGIKAGIITLLGDCFKCVFAVALVHLLFGKSHSHIIPVLSMYAGMGAVLGHNYPFYMKFKGGKGIATTAGLILSTTNPYMVLICLAAFILIVAATRYVSLGSMAVASIYFIEVLVYGQMGGYPVTSTGLIEMYVIAGLLMLSAFYKHKANIKRLLSGTENKFTIGKNNKNK